MKKFLALTFSFIGCLHAMQDLDKKVLLAAIQEKGENGFQFLQDNLTKSSPATVCVQYQVSQRGDLPFSKLDLSVAFHRRYNGYYPIPDTTSDGQLITEKTIYVKKTSEYPRSEVSFGPYTDAIPMGTYKSYTFTTAYDQTDLDQLGTDQK